MSQQIARIRPGHLIGLAFVVLGLAVLGLRAAPPTAGTSIGNAASATYTDSSGASRQTTSNVVTTIVQTVRAFTLTENRSVTVAPGGQVAYAHTLSNTGNASDSYNLATPTNTGGFTLTGVTIFADVNKDGVPDNNTPITVTPGLAAGESFGFVVVGNAPAAAAGTNTITVTGTSVGNAAVQTNTDTATVTSNAVISVTKTISSSSGPSPSVSPHLTYTLTYTNTGNAAATDFTISDGIPTGMTYRAGTARWSVTGATVLTDLDATDNQSGVVYDFAVTTALTARFRIATVNPGASGIVSFEVSVNSSVVPGVIPNTATFVYDPDGTGPSPVTTSVNTNTVPYTVTQNVGVEIGDVTVSTDLEGETAPTAGALIGTVAAAAPGSTVTFVNAVRNTGNGTDSFDIIVAQGNFPAGTTFILYKADGNTPLVDTNGNSTGDTGPLAPAATINITVKATLPTSGLGTGPYTSTITATSKTSPGTARGVNTAVNTLTAASGLTVDLTNDAAANVGGALGIGAGPDGSAGVGSPVKTNTTNPGTVTIFDLFVRNPNTIADTYTIQLTDVSGNPITPPAGWTVVFKDATGAVISSTGVVAAGGNSAVVKVEILPPAGTPPGNTDFFFRVISPTTGTNDIIRDRVTVNTVRDIVITPNNSGQTFPGGSVVYEHTVTNNGNVLEGVLATLGGTGGSRIALGLTDSQSAAGWTSVQNADTNGNGVLDAADAVITDLSYVSAGGAGLSIGETVRVFTKVFAPSGAPNLTINTTTLTATTANGTGTGAYTTTAPAAVSARDVTTVVLGDLAITKRQALDAACDGTADTAYSVAQVTTGAVPGACIMYEITVTNTGSVASTNVIVYDVTPAFTTYNSTGGAAACTGGTTNTTAAPANGAAGNFVFTVGTLAPGASATATFKVRINP